MAINVQDAVCESISEIGVHKTCVQTLSAASVPLSRFTLAQHLGMIYALDALIGYLIEFGTVPQRKLYLPRLTEQHARFEQGIDNV